ncbi:hypothetical protein, partial [Mesorhizobium sp. M8A.F.Ca.ET.213.01.1.1]|uniref:hypothetical protein n=1 Tax=Mesorhizobium sp. M8A.F.Ca.ET.213.01.1.1 TaxID=2563970 RepID=UPI001AEE3D86
LRSWQPFDAPRGADRIGGRFDERDRHVRGCHIRPFVGWRPKSFAFDPSTMTSDPLKLGLGAFDWPARVNLAYEMHVSRV